MSFISLDLVEARGGSGTSGHHLGISDLASLDGEVSGFGERDSLSYRRRRRRGWPARPRLW
jgi:hypothetical protein